MVTILIQTESHYPINKKKIREAIGRVIDGKFKRDVEISVTVIGDRRMKQLNSSYRKIADTTDVLSFPQDDPSQTMHPFINSPDNVLYLGDIVVSFPQAIVEASEENKLVDDKINELVLHGLNHLMGIHHPE